jgi:hypothetical protein
MNRNAAFAVACLAVSLAVAAACFASGTGWPILALLFLRISPDEKEEE